MVRVAESLKNIDISPTGINSLIAYGAGAGSCLVGYGYRYGVKALREYWIDKTKNPNRVDAGTHLTRYCTDL